MATIADSGKAQQHWADATDRLVVPTPDTSLVTAVYETALDRAPDQTGLLAWTQALQGGLTPAQFAQDIIGSSEYQNLHGSQIPSELVTQGLRMRFHPDLGQRP